MNLHTLFLSLCLWCITTPAIASQTNEQCFASRESAREVHKTEHLYRKDTEKGRCWHIGQGHSVEWQKTGGIVAAGALKQKEATRVAKPQEAYQWPSNVHVNGWPKLYGVEHAETMWPREGETITGYWLLPPMEHPHWRIPWEKNNGGL